MMTVSSSKEDVIHYRKRQSWDYHDKNGSIFFRMTRKDAFIKKDGQFKPYLGQDGSKQKKTFYPEHLNDDGCWVRGLPEFPKAGRPLYHLPDVIRSDKVIVVEGEKAADAAQKMFPNHVVTTNSGGAHAASQSDWSVLKGKDVVLIPDADQSGESWLKGIARKLREV